MHTPWTTSVNPSWHSQRCDPCVLMHTECFRQKCFPVLHSFMSVQWLPFPSNPMLHLHSKRDPFFFNPPSSLHFVEVMLNEQMALDNGLVVMFLPQKHFPPTFWHVLTAPLSDWQVSLQDDPAQLSGQEQLTGSPLQFASILHAAHEQTKDVRFAEVKPVPEMSFGSWQMAPSNVNPGLLDNHVGSHLKWQLQFKGLLRRWTASRCPRSSKDPFWIEEILQWLNSIVVRRRSPLKASASINSSGLLLT